MAKPVTVTITHELGREGAIARIKSGFGQVAGALGSAVAIDQRWEADTLHFTARVMMQTVTGRLDVFEKNVRIEIVLPGLLGSMAGAIAGRLQQKGALLLEKK